MAIETTLLSIKNTFAKQITNPWLLVDTSKQCLYLVNDESVIEKYQVSTSKYGFGSEQNSYKTPLGAHVIAEKIGGHCRLNEILQARKSTGEFAQSIDRPVTSTQDLVLTRILWLRGLEAGKNSGQGVDTYQRYIYIHGTQEEGLIGAPASHGCIRMRNVEVVDLYSRISKDSFVYIL